MHMMMHPVIYPLIYPVMHPKVSPLMRHGVAGGDSRMAAAFQNQHHTPTHTPVAHWNSTSSNSPINSRGAPK